VSNYTKSEYKGRYKWKVSEYPCGNFTGRAIHFNEDAEQVTDHVYARADADLIAAATMLLETLKHLLEEGCITEDGYQFAFDAINEAEGIIKTP